MNPAIALIALIAAMLVAVLWWLLRVLLRPASHGPVAQGLSDAEQANVDALRGELSEARRDHQAGKAALLSPRRLLISIAITVNTPPEKSDYLPAYSCAYRKAAWWRHWHDPAILAPWQYRHCAPKRLSPPSPAVNARRSREHRR